MWWLMLIVSYLFIILNKDKDNNLILQMSKIKEYYLNNLTEDEIKEKAEEEINRLELLWELKEIIETSTSQSN